MAIATFKQVYSIVSSSVNMTYGFADLAGCGSDLAGTGISSGEGEEFV